MEDNKACFDVDGNKEEERVCCRVNSDKCRRDVGKSGGLDPRHK